jgi:ribosomal protein S20
VEEPLKLELRCLVQRPLLSQLIPLPLLQLAVNFSSIEPRNANCNTRCRYNASRLLLLPLPLAVRASVQYLKRVRLTIKSRIRNIGTREKIFTTVEEVSKYTTNRDRSFATKFTPQTDSVFSSTISTKYPTIDCISTT